MDHKELPAQSKKSTGLRQQAEATARGQSVDRPANLDELSAEDMQPLLHELQVHQIELKMQNDELHQAQQRKS